MFRVKLIHQMAGRCGEFYRPRRHASCSVSLIALLLLMSGLETNPGPPIKMGLWNAQSVVHRGSLVQDLIESHQLDALAICESKIVCDDPDAIKLDSAPDGFDVLHVPRPTATARNRGGGLCFVYRESITVKTHPLQQTLSYTSFECQLLRLHVGSTSSTDGTTVAVIYRPPSSSLPTFYDELSDLLAKVGDVIDTDQFVACGDVNCGGADSTSVRGELSTLLEAHGLRQFVTSATRTTTTTSSLLDVVVANIGSSQIAHTTVQPTHHVSVHELVTWS